ncbi:Ribonuclease J (endonuclease and 5' exonuclease) [hydrothermal vent metagenome]|uniref:Ribonuclease J (Endonuclease and 5' exonuclease) n=1 Tax=hydrothermal vent metagenome TaxID=652676 RepID=A0A3B0V303_9ZZZZ
MTPAPAPAPAPSSEPHSNNSNNRPPIKRYPSQQRSYGTVSHHGARRMTHSNTGNKPYNKKGLHQSRPGAATRRIQRALHRPMATHKRTKNVPDYFPKPPAENVARIVPLGGVEEVGRNMTAVDINGDIFVMDVGFEFTGEDETPGIDYLLPNTAYLEKNKDRIRAVIITHGHLDHIGGIPFIMKRIGNPPIYTQKLTSLMIAKRQEEYPDVPKPEIIIVEPGTERTISNTKVKFFSVTHSIPDAMGISLVTPQGNVVITGDLKLDHEGTDPLEHEKKTWGEVGKDNNIFLMADSTNAERDGFSIPEQRVHETLSEIIRTVKGRLIIGTFASQFERIIRITEFAEQYGKKIVTEGRSIKTNIEIAQKAGMLKVKNDTIIPAQAIGDYPPDKILILATGAQGEEFAALMRIATKQHRFIQFTERDTIVLSSSVIPGNEVSVQKLKDNLYRNNVTIINYRSSDVHSTGHGNAGELVWVNQQVNAKFFMPGYGYRSMTASHAKAVEQAGRPRDTIFIADNGNVIDIIDGKEMKVHKERVPNSPLAVDGFSIGGLQEVVIRDRQLLAKDGMFVIIATVQLKTGRLKKSPDIISRGFIYLRESQDLLNQARLLIKKTVEDSTRGMNPIDLDYVKNVLTDTMAGYLFTRTNKAPMVIPVLIGV